MYHFCGFHTFSVQLEAGKQKSVQLEAGPTPMIEWTQEALLRRFGLPADWMPATSAEFDDFDARCIDLLREPANVSGFKEVYACLGDKPWQAKVYVGPGRQRHLGSFATELEAAKAIYWWRVSGDKLNSPKKDRNKRGEGRRKRDRRKGAGRLPSLAFTSVLICCACLLAHRSHFAAQDCRDDKVKDAAPRPSAAHWDPV